MAGARRSADLRVPALADVHVHGATEQMIGA
jgi:hypothetical protein